MCMSGSGNADQRLSLPLNVKCVFTYVCMCMCETGDREEEEVENVSVNLSGQQLINEVLEMFYCMNTQAHTHMLAIFVVLRVCVCLTCSDVNLTPVFFCESLPII